MYLRPARYTRNRSGGIEPDNSAITQGIQSVDFVKVSGRYRLNSSERKAMKILRNIIGTAGLIYAGYVFVVSLKDVRRYIRISSM